MILCNCPGAITGFLCRAPENNPPNILSCKSPCPVRAPPGLCPRTTEITEKRRSYRMRKIIPQKSYYVIAPGALTGFSCRAPENNSKIIFPACNHFDSEAMCLFPAWVASPPSLLQEHPGPFGPEVCRECPSGCLWRPSSPALRSVQKVSRECPQSLEKVSQSCLACSPENFCEFFFRVCLGILHWKMPGIFGEFFLVSVSHETKHEKS